MNGCCEQPLTGRLRQCHNRNQGIIACIVPTVQSGAPPCRLPFSSPIVSGQPNEAIAMRFASGWRRADCAIPSAAYRRTCTSLPDDHRDRRKRPGERHPADAGTVFHRACGIRCRDGLDSLPKPAPARAAQKTNALEPDADSGAPTAGKAAPPAALEPDTASDAAAQPIPTAPPRSFTPSLNTIVHSFRRTVTKE
ncbi:MAG: hypothetical protein JWL77_6191 [Chthonomonadaceae bacterium]|nr:hypothetical protein [Chthonomonadaceae bacterium]